MRPNRIGAWPLSLQPGGGAGSSVINMSSVTQGTLNANRTAIDKVELFPGIAAEIHDTIYSRSVHYSGALTVVLTNDLPRFSVGGFVLPSGQRSVNAEPQPLYVRFVGSMSVHAGNGNAYFLQPVIGVKSNSDPISLGTSDSDKDSRAIGSPRVLPVHHVSHHAFGAVGELYSAETDVTIALGNVFSRFGGTGFSGDTVFGVGWSILMPGRASGHRGSIEGHMEFSVSAWFYTADLDMYDPNKS